MPISSSRTATTAPIRVPEITIYFWIVKILTTAVGETTSDYLGEQSAVIAAVVGAVGLAIALVIQFRMGRYVAWAYWFAVVMVAIFGTMAADVVHSLHVSYMAAASVLLVLLIVVFALWYRSEGTLSIHSINTRRSEIYYWTTVMVTFALGTAVGDLTATTFGWGYLTSGIIFAIAFAAVGLAHFAVSRALPANHRHRPTNGVAAFWIAYILTRPLGASFADWLGAVPAKGGLGWGEGNVSIGLFAIIIVVVGYLAITKRDVPDADDAVDVSRVEGFA